MIDLGQICCRHPASVYEARRKIRGLAEALGYDPIETTRLATAVSQAVRQLQREQSEPRVVVGLATDCAGGQLVLDFEGRGTPTDMPALAAFFDNVCQRDPREGYHSLRALRLLPNGFANIRPKLNAVGQTMNLEVPRRTSSRPKHSF